MQIGFNLPISGPLSCPDAVVQIAQQGEALGYDYLTLTDHIVLPNLQVPGYPYSESGEFFAEGPERRHEQLTTAAYIAAKTSRIGLVLAVMVVPHRPAVLAAKMLATIDVLSGGRLVVGIGAGWLQAEFEAAVTTPFAARGAVTDEYLRAFRELWTEEEPRAPCGTAGRRLVSDRQQQPAPARHPAALPGRDRPAAAADHRGRTRPG